MLNYKFFDALDEFEWVQVEAVSQKRIPGRGNDEKVYFPPDGARGEAGRAQSAAFKSAGAQRKDRGLVYDLKENQAWPFLAKFVFTSLYCYC